MVGKVGADEACSTCNKRTQGSLLLEAGTGSSQPKVRLQSTPVLPGPRPASSSRSVRAHIQVLDDEVARNGPDLTGFPYAGAMGRGPNTFQHVGTGYLDDGGRPRRREDAP